MCVESRLAASAKVLSTAQAFVGHRSTFSGLQTRASRPGDKRLAEWSRCSMEYRSAHRRLGRGFHRDAKQRVRPLPLTLSSLRGIRIMGSGHGWSTGNSMAWNSRCSARLVIQKPPTSQNFAVGVTAGDATKTDGLVISPNQQVRPIGLFAAQLHKRVGQALTEQILGIQL